MKLEIELGDISIFQATLDDLDEILAIENHVFSTPWSRKAFEAEINGNEFSSIFIARSRDSSRVCPSTDLGATPPMVGYICVWIVFEELRFMNIAVDAKLRRQGIASKLLSRSIEAGVGQGAQRGLLEVRKSNHVAQALYMHFGFQSYGSRRQYYTNPNEDAMLMALEPIVFPFR